MEHCALLPVVAGAKVMVLVPPSHTGVDASAPVMVKVTVPVGVNELCSTVAVKTVGAPV